MLLVTDPGHTVSNLVNFARLGYRIMSKSDRYYKRGPSQLWANKNFRAGGMFQKSPIKQ